MFENVNPKQNFPELEKKWLKIWKENSTFQKSIDQRSKEDEFIFYDGPPFATGLPHYGHILAGTMKDVVPRYWTMRGKRVERRFGWDCHGLPVENVVEKEYGLKSKQEVEEKFGVADFNEKCRASVLKYTSEWEETVERMGRWVDFKNDYKTMDPQYMESIWWVFSELWKKDLIYRGHKVMWVSPALVTPLSNFEVSLGYKDVKDNSVIWKFPLKEDPNTHLLAWTTTPWSTLSTMGLAVGAEHTYLKVKIDEQNYIFVKDRKDFVLKGIEDYEIVEEFKGQKLVGLEYLPLNDNYRDLPELQGNDKVYKVYATDYVETKEGTGLVTINGSYGEIDMEAAKANGLPFVLDAEMNGHFNEKSGEYNGMYFKDAELKMLKDFKDTRIFRVEKYKHNYPHCWRTDVPLMMYATESWFVNVEKIKETMLKANQDINWTPAHIKDGRFGKWLENARDWCISRNRFWGAPLPLWINDQDKNDIICIESIQDLKDQTGEDVTDLHKHFVDNYKIQKDGKTYTRTPEVLDCWFESGAMPYAQHHYPFENKENFEKNFPAQFIAEGLDQTRGWFYTLVVLGSALFGKSPFKNVIVNGMILAEDGKKMSKRLKNYPDPAHMFDQYGADALRFYLMSSPVVKSQPLRFSEKGVSDIVRKILLPIWNSYSFFTTYANIDNWTPGEEFKDNNYVPKTVNTLDKWAISELENLLRGLTGEMDTYDLQRATEPVTEFIESLTNWYIRRSRRRFWKSDSDQDKDSAYKTLYYCLVKLSQIIAPFTPFIAEEIYTNLTSQESVHLSDWPEFSNDNIDLDLNEEVALARKVVSLGHTLRARLKLKVRQPLQAVKVALADEVDKELILKQKEVILEELNVKELILISENDGIVETTVKVNPKLLGPKYPDQIQEIIKATKTGDYQILEDGNIKVLDLTLTDEEAEIVYQGAPGQEVQCDRGVVVAFDTNVTKDLKLEGIARELVRHIQELRKKADLNVDQRIKVQVNAQGEVLEALEQFTDYIKQETLTEEISEVSAAKIEQEINIQDQTITIKIA